MSHQPPGEVFRRDSWRSRGFLPHFTAAGLAQQLTFRLADSLPRQLVSQWREELAASPAGARAEILEKRTAIFLDRGHGACHLRDERIAQMGAFA